MSKFVTYLIQLPEALDASSSIVSGVRELVEKHRGKIIRESPEVEIEVALEAAHKAAIAPSDTFPDPAHAKSLAPSAIPEYAELEHAVAERIKKGAKEGARAIWLTRKDGYRPGKQSPRIQRLIDLLEQKQYDLIEETLNGHLALKVCWGVHLTHDSSATN